MIHASAGGPTTSIDMASGGAQDMIHGFAPIALRLKMTWSPALWGV